MTAIIGEQGTGAQQSGTQRPVTEPMARGMRTTIAIFVAVPLLAVVLAIPVAWAAGSAGPT